MNTRAFGSQLKDCIPVSDFSAAGAFESYDVINRGCQSELRMHDIRSLWNFLGAQLEDFKIRCLLAIMDSFTNVKSELFPVHPLELSEKNFSLNQDKMNFSTLRNIQGLHAPLKLQMEFKAVKQAQRLPFLHSSNLSLDILKGNYDCIGFEDILNDPAQSEVMGDPHLLVEQKLGLL